MSSREKGELLQLERDYLLAIAFREMEGELQAKGGASDLVQETLLEAVRDIDQFEGGTVESFRGWLRSVLLNNLTNFRRRYLGAAKRNVDREKSINQHPEASNNFSQSLSPSGMAMRGEMLTALNSAKATLPPNYQEVLELRSIQRLPFEEVATRISKSPEAARKLWCRAMALLQSQFNASKHDISGLQ